MLPSNLFDQSLSIVTDIQFLPGGTGTSSLDDSELKKVTVKGDTALATYEGKDEKGKPSDVVMRLKRKGDDWRVVAIENAEELMAKAPK